MPPDPHSLQYYTTSGLEVLATGVNAESVAVELPNGALVEPTRATKTFVLKNMPNGEWQSQIQVSNRS